MLPLALIALLISCIEPTLSDSSFVDKLLHDILCVAPVPFTACTVLTQLLCAGVAWLYRGHLQWVNAFQQEGILVWWRHQSLVEA